MLRRICIIVVSIATWGHAGSFGSQDPLFSRQITEARALEHIIQIGRAHV